MRGLIVPGLNGSGYAHWQTLWEQKYLFERVRQQDWTNPDAVDWVETLDTTIRKSPEKAVIIAHSLGCWTVIRWAASHADSKNRVYSALLVAPPDIESHDALSKSAKGFTRCKENKLPFPSILVGSENDPYMTLDKAKLLAHSAGSRFVNAGFVGPINVDSGHGPWPQGEKLLRRLIGNSL